MKDDDYYISSTEEVVILLAALTQDQALSIRKTSLSKLSLSQLQYIIKTILCSNPGFVISI